MPWLLGLVGLLGGFLAPSLWILTAPWKDSLLDKVVVACAIFVAYLVTAATIIPAVEEKAIIRKLKNWGYFRYIVDYLRHALWASSALLLISLAAIPLPESWMANAAFNGVFSAAWWGVFAFTVGAVFRATSILIKLLLAR